MVQNLARSCTAIALAAALATAPSAFATVPTQAPTNLHVTATTARTIAVAWDGPPAGVTGTATCLSGPGVADIAYGGCGFPDGMIQTSWVIDRLVCGSTYTVQAAWMGGPMQIGPYATITPSTSPCTRPAPPVPTGLEQVGETGSTIDLAWDPPAVSGVQSTWVRYTTPSLGGGTLQQGGGSFEGSVRTDYTATKLLCGTTYDIEVAWISDEGRISAATRGTAQTEDCADLGPVPDAPTGLHISAATAAGFTFAWDFPPAGLPVTRIRRTLLQPGRVDDHLESGAPTSWTTNTAYLPCATVYTFRLQWVLSDGRVSLPAEITTPSTPACPVRQTTSAPTGTTHPVSTPPPRLTAISLTPSNPVAGTRLVVRFTASEKVTTTLTVIRQDAGRRKGGRCVKPTRALKKARACTRGVTVRTLKVTGAAGRTTTALQTRGLKPARYVLTLRARVDADGRTSGISTKPFTVRKADARRSR